MASWSSIVATVPVDFSADVELVLSGLAAGVGAAADDVSARFGSGVMISAAG